MAKSSPIPKFTGHVVKGNHAFIAIVGLYETDYYDVLCKTTLCPNKLKNHSAVKIVNRPCPKCHEVIVSQSCYDLHVKMCQGHHKCIKYDKLIIANAKRGQSLEQKIQDHVCHATLCKRCWEQIPPGQNDKNQHCCQLQPPSYPKFFPQLGFFDIEGSEYGKNRQHLDQLLCFSYERKFAGVFQDVAFGSRAFKHLLLDSVQLPHFFSDYLPSNVSNVFDEEDRLKPPRISKKRKHQGEIKEEEVEPVVRANLSNVMESHDWNHEIKLDYQAYFENLKKFSKDVPYRMRQSPVFKFLCFILNKRHANRVIISHYGSRYDQVHVIRVLKAMNIKIDVLAQGMGILSLSIPSLGIVFLDSWKFLLEPLSKLPKRFGLEEEKGLFCFAYNTVNHWNIIKPKPPPLSYYLDDFKDSPETKLAKQRWYEDVKMKEPRFDLNDDCVVYCKKRR